MTDAGSAPDAMHAAPGVLMPFAPDALWRVSGGQADVFAGLGNGKRRHLATLPAGTVLLPAPAGPVRLWLRLRRGACLERADGVGGAEPWLLALGCDEEDLPVAGVHTEQDAGRLAKEGLARLASHLQDDPADVAAPSDRAFPEALAGFAALMRGRFRRAPDARRPTPLARAATRLVEALHLKPVPLDQEDGEAADGYLERFAAANRLRLRRIRLDGIPPNGEAGMIAFAEGDAPVVLTPAFLRGTWCENGSRRHRMRDADWTALLPDAFAFHPLLPDGPLTYRQVMLFGLRPGLPDMVLVVACGLVGSLLALLPLSAATAVARIGVHSRDLVFLAEIMTALLCALAAEAVVQTVTQLARLRFGGRAALTLMAAMLDRMVRLPPAALRGSTQAIIATQMESVTKLRGSALALLATGVLALFNGLSAGVLIAVHAPFAGLGVIGAVLLLLAVAALLGWAQFRAIYEGERMDVVVLAFAYDLVRAVPVLRAMRAEKRAYAQWALNFLAFQSRLMRSARLQNHFRSFEAGWDVAATAVAFGTVALAGALGTMDAAAAIAFVLILSRLLAAGRELAHVVLGAGKLMPMAKLSRSFIETGLPPPRPALGPVLQGGGIDIRNVCFAYGAREVLSDLSLSVADGEFVGIVGPSGSGKSTLLRLLLGLERPSQGTVLFDGHDVQSLDRRGFARHVGAVLQNGQLFPGSIFDNIRGAGAIGLDEAAGFAALAGLEPDLRRMPMGLRTLVGEGGTGLSRGQVQRVLLARALAQRPSVLVLDEAVSALDGGAQAEMMQALGRLPVTRVVVAHSPGMLTRADRIVLLQDGRIVPHAWPASLLHSTHGA